MSNFELPGLIGFDPMRPPTLPMQGPQLQGMPRLGLSPLDVQDPERLGRRAAPLGGDGGAAPRFDGVLAESLARVQSLQDDVQQKTRNLALGQGDVEVHDVLLATGKSEVAFNLLLEVRNKLVEAWEKLSRSAV